MPEDFPERPDHAENSEASAEQSKERFFLEKISKIKEAEHPESLKAYVCGYIVRHCRGDRRAVMFFIDLMNGDMAKGLVARLVRKSQSRPFFDQFYGCIEMARERFEERVGEPLFIEGDLKNDLAWMGIGETAREIVEELGMDAGDISSLSPLDFSDVESGDCLEEEPGLLEQVEKLKDDGYPKSLESHVLRYILENCPNDEEVEVFFHDVENSGSISGWVPHLITHADMEEFYDEFYEDIEGIRKRLESITGRPLDINNRLKSFFAHLAFDETAKEIAGELGLENGGAPSEEESGKASGLLDKARGINREWLENPLKARFLDYIEDACRDDESLEKFLTNILEKGSIADFIDHLGSHESVEKVIGRPENISGPLKSFFNKFGLTAAAEEIAREIGLEIRA